MGYKKSTEMGWLTGVKPAVTGLYYRGGIDQLWGKCAAVVGSRRMTEYGLRVVELLVPKLVEGGWTIVSGFMYGVDQAAHRICIACGGVTVAVLGWGIEEPMMGEEEELAQRILDGGGAIVSEWKKQKGALWTFPMRNRIVAAMSQEVFVVEAAQHSGALITAELARKMGKKIWAVPGPVTSRVSAGTNNLIAAGMAQMWRPSESVRAGEFVSSRKNADLYSLLENEALTVDELVVRAKKPAAEIMADLTVMLLRGEVAEREGKYYVE